MQRILSRGFRLLLRAGLLLSVLALASLTLLAGALETAPGQALLRSAIERFGGIGLASLDGSPLRRTTLGGIVLRDEAGPWLSIDRLTLAWNPASLLRGQASIGAIEITGASLLRLPEAEAETEHGQAAAEREAASFTLPLALRVAALRISGARVAAALLDAPEDARLDGEAHLSLDRALRGEAALSFRLSGIGDGRVTLDITRGAAIAARLSIAEPPGGFIARLAGLPSLGALTVEATVDGSASEAAVEARLYLGEGVAATAEGTLDTIGAGNDLRLTAWAGAAALEALIGSLLPPSPLGEALSIAGVELAASVTGRLTSPRLDGTVAMAALSAAGARLEGVRATVASLAAGAGRTVEAEVTAEEAIPPSPAAPLGPARLRLRGALGGDGAVALESLSLETAHATVTGEGRIDGGEASGAARIGIASLGALVPEGGIEGEVDAALALAPGGRLTLEATLDHIQGPGPVAALLGPRATIAAAGRAGQALELERFTLEGQAITLDAAGALSDTVTLDAGIELPLLTALSPELHGRASARITASGPVADPSLALTLTVPRIGVAALPPGSLDVTASVTHALSAPDATLEGVGTVAGEPVTMALRLLPRRDGTLDLPEAALAWGGMRLSASGSVLADGRPDVSATLTVPSLGPLGRLLGEALSGAVRAEARLRPEGAGVTGTATGEADGLRLPGADIARLSFRARADDLFGRQAIDAAAEAKGLTAGGITTGARVTAKGGLDDLALTAALDGADHRLRAEARFAVPGTLRLASLDARWKGETLRLAAPAIITLSPRLAIDRLALSLARGGRIEARGQAGDALDLTVTARRLPLALAALAAPGLAAEGTLDADARITGTPAAPEGGVKLALRGAGLERTPRADLDATVTLAGGEARLDARLRSGETVRLTLDAAAPIGAPQAGRATLAGTIDLAVLDPMLTPAGRQARGRVRLDLSWRAGRLGGGVRLAEASLSDAVLGARLDGIGGRITAEGETLGIDLGARAGGGRLQLDGTVSPFAPSLPVALRLTANDASIAIGTMLSTRFDAAITLDGALARGLDVSGRIDVARADVRLPDRLPPNIVALPVEVAGAPPEAQAPASAEPAVPIGLDVTIEAPRAVFVRGQGLDAELGGSLRATGTAEDPRLAGVLTLREGTLARLGQSFTFRRGSIAFDGAAGLMPTLDFEAERRLADLTALIRVSGEPKDLSITLTSEPEAPSDEILSRILFGRPQNGLTPAQLIQLASAAAELAGLTSPGGGLLERARTGLGLDRLSAGAAEGGGGEVEAGRYVAEGVYVGARQRTDGTPQATIQLEVLPGLRLEADIGGESSDRVGASIGFEY